MGGSECLPRPFPKYSWQACYALSTQRTAKHVFFHGFEGLWYIPSITLGTLSSQLFDSWGLHNHFTWDNSSECGFLLKDLPPTQDGYASCVVITLGNVSPSH